MKNTISHQSWLKKYLAVPEKAAAYLNAVAEDKDIRFLLKALRNVVKAQGGVGVLAKSTKMSRTTLYKTLSPAGNPEIKTLKTILEIYGIRIGFFAIGRNSRRRPSSLRPPYDATHYLTT
ncbi:MAG: transcriptional regulator [Elusimicrobia bacterium]|nr:transcriptional regulator [Elusimicrobiota bacterium]